MTPVRWVGLILALVCVAFPPSVSAAPTAAVAATHVTAVTPCTAFGKTWAHKYNSQGGPVKIVSVCCGLRSPKTHLSACKMVVTGRDGMMGAGMYGCGIATVAANGNILANKPRDCVSLRGISLPE